MTTLINNAQRVVLACLLLVAIPSIWVGAHEAWRNWHDLQRFHKTIGTIVANSYQSSSGHGGIYHPVVVFTAGDGPEIRVTDTIGSLPPDYIVGSRVEVLYDPSQPSTIRLIDWKRLWLVPILFMALGVLPLCLYGSWWLIRRRLA